MTPCPSDPTPFLRREAREAIARGGHAEAWDLLTRLPSPGPADDRMMLEVARAMGAPDLSWQTLLRMVDRPDPDLRTLTGAASSMVRAGDPAAAVEITDRLLERFPDHAALHAVRVSAMVLAESGDVGPPMDRWTASMEGPEERLRAADLATQAGEFARARVLYDAVRPTWEGPEALAGLARLALWGLSLDEAGSLARAALSRGASPLAQHSLAAVSVLRGRVDDGLAALDRLLEETPEDAVAHAWRAEALLRMRRPVEARLAADRAMMCSRGYNLPARVLRFLALVDENGRRGYTRRALNNELMDQLVPIFGPAPPRSRSTLVAALEAFGGNRSDALTWCRDGTLVRYPRPPDPRNLARHAQSVFKVRGPAAAQATLDQLARETDGHPLVNTYRGEFLLWCGAYAEAAAAFSASLERDRATKWAWIGLGATWMLRGDRKRALETWDEGLAVTHFAGPTLWAYKGECLRREGRYAEAREALEVARETSPRRLATHINLALLDAIDGDPRPAARLAASLEAENRSLVGDGSPAEQLEQALSCMRGNRSSSLVTWFDDQVRMRMLRWRVS